MLSYTSAASESASQYCATSSVNPELTTVGTLSVANTSGNNPA